ncbi:hypothetical protein [Paraglaciecola sp. MB-3u-78]|jgi:hypothetical protein|uniref:hypothetical protein n=1 Tax=Paraglaciecola sp. MB-3u-78 TaxID=2058332 RepID=UPI001E3F2AFE|nr:hypothetical protein [Paraglaciecola sp. MB-3u-78]
MFNQHGDFNITLQGDILFVVVTGPWNAETANAYRAAILKTIEPGKGKLWGFMIIYPGPFSSHGQKCENIDLKI